MAVPLQLSRVFLTAQISAGNSPLSVSDTVFGKNPVAPSRFAALPEFSRVGPSVASGAYGKTSITPDLSDLVLLC